MFSAIPLAGAPIFFLCCLQISGSDLVQPCGQVSKRGTLAGHVFFLGLLQTQSCGQDGKRGHVPCKICRAVDQCYLQGHMKILAANALSLGKAI